MKQVRDKIHIKMAKNEILRQIFISVLLYGKASGLYRDTATTKLNDTLPILPIMLYVTQKLRHDEMVG
jgi:hypothetical protein